MTDTLMKYLYKSISKKYCNYKKFAYVRHKNGKQSQSG